MRLSRHARTWGLVVSGRRNQLRTGATRRCDRRARGRRGSTTGSAPPASDALHFLAGARRAAGRTPDPVRTGSRRTPAQRPSRDIGWKVLLEPGRHDRFQRSLAGVATASARSLPELAPMRICDGDERLRRPTARHRCSPSCARGHQEALRRPCDTPGRVRMQREQRRSLTDVYVRRRPVRHPRRIMAVAVERRAAQPSVGQGRGPRRRARRLRVEIGRDAPSVGREHGRVKVALLELSPRRLLPSRSRPARASGALPGCRRPSRCRATANCAASVARDARRRSRSAPARRRSGPAARDRKRRRAAMPSARA